MRFTEHLPPPHTVVPNPQRGEAHALVARVGLWPFVRVDVQGDHAALHSGGRDACIASLDLVTGALTAFVPTGLRDSLVRTEPLVRLARDGVRVDVVDAESIRTGERLIRWRLDLERFGGQLLDASP